MKTYLYLRPLLGAGFLIAGACSSKKATPPAQQAPAQQAKETAKPAQRTDVSVAATTTGFFQPPLKAYFHDSSATTLGTSHPNDGQPPTRQGFKTRRSEVHRSISQCAYWRGTKGLC